MKKLIKILIPLSFVLILLFLGLEAVWAEPMDTSKCEYYKDLQQVCNLSSENDPYPGDVYQCCKDFGDGLKEKKIRGCLIEKDKKLCAKETDIDERNNCRVCIHWTCYTKYVGVDTYFKIPPSCDKPLKDLGGVSYLLLWPRSGYCPAP